MDPWQQPVDMQLKHFSSQMPLHNTPKLTMKTGHLKNMLTHASQSCSRAGMQLTVARAGGQVRQVQVQNALPEVAAAPHALHGNKMKDFLQHPQVTREYVMKKLRQAPVCYAVNSIKALYKMTGSAADVMHTVKSVDTATACLLIQVTTESLHKHLNSPPCRAQE